MMNRRGFRGEVKFVNAHTRITLRFISSHSTYAALTEIASKWNRSKKMYGVWTISNHYSSSASPHLQKKSNYSNSQ